MDYYPFGMAMPGRKYSATSAYRYGFNGKESDTEISSTTTYDYGFRIYNPALGKFLSVDPLSYSYAMLTPYQFASNSPINSIDRDGLEKIEFFVLLGEQNSNVLVGKQKAIQISYDLEAKVVKAMYGVVGGESMNFEYNTVEQEFSYSKGTLIAPDIISAYGQVGTRLSKRQISKGLTLHRIFKNIGIIFGSDVDFLGLDKQFDEWDELAYEKMEAIGFSDLHVPPTKELAKKFVDNKSFQFQELKEDGVETTRLFVNDEIKITEDTYIKLVLFQYVEDVDGAKKAGVLAEEIGRSLKKILNSAKISTDKKEEKTE